MVAAERLELPGHDIVGIRAENGGPFTLSGTNSWIVGREPAWLVDPGPALPAHIEALSEEIARRGGLGGIALTHRHHDHDEGLPGLRALHPASPLAAARDPADVRLRDGVRFGPLTAIPTPGHAPDHMALLTEGVILTGDAVLGEGSVFVAPDPGALRRYLEALERLRSLGAELLAPGHGPPVLDPAAKLTEYLEHRRARERALLEALAAGRRTVEELLDAAWPEVPRALRPAAAITLRAHLDKLQEEDRLPSGVERPTWPVPWLREV
jgi:glyoxylase-like metal-dependent hydrolase (beta-lactamase superfamily II)